MTTTDKLTDRDWLISLLTIEQEQMLTDYEVHPDAWKGDPERTDCTAALADGILEGLAHRRASQAAPAPMERVWRHIGPPSPAPSDALRDVMAERERQMAVEGWTPEHDDRHDGGEMAWAASCYARLAGTGIREMVPTGWPWDASWWKPKSQRKDLVRAAALILAEIERLDRAALSTPTEERQ